MFGQSIVARRDWLCALAMGRPLRCAEPCSSLLQWGCQGCESDYSRPRKKVWFGFLMGS